MKKQFVLSCIMCIYIMSALSADWQLYDDFSTGSMDWSKWTQDPEPDELADVIDGQMRLAVIQAPGIDSTDTQADIINPCTAVSADMQLLASSTGLDCGLKMMVALQQPFDAGLSIWRDGANTYIVPAFVNDDTEESWYGYVNMGTFENETTYNFTIQVNSNSIDYYVDYALVGTYTTQLGIGTPPYKVERIGFETRTYAEGDFVDGRVDNVYIIPGTPPHINIAVTNSTVLLEINDLVTVRSTNALLSCTNLSSGQWSVVETFLPYYSSTNFTLNTSNFPNSVFFTIGKP